MSWLRALAAGGLSVLMPGAGHALIRDWLRALGFAGVFIAASVVLLPTSEMAAADSVTGSLNVAAEETTLVTQFVLYTIALYAAIDATFRAKGLTPSEGGDGDGPSCPECGKELDDDLSFCHWCTTRLEPEAVEADDGAA